MIIMLFLHYTKNIFNDDGVLISEYDISIEADRMLLSHLNEVINSIGVPRLVKTAREEHKSWEFDNASVNIYQEYRGFDLIAEDDIKFFPDHQRADIAMVAHERYCTSTRVKRISGKTEWYITID